MNKNKIRMSAIVMMAVIFVQSASVYAANNFSYNSGHEDGAASQKDGTVTIGFNEANGHESSTTGESGGGKGSGGTTPSTSIGTTNNRQAWSFVMTAKSRKQARQHPIGLFLCQTIRMDY